MDQMFSVTKAANLVGVSRTTIYRLHKDGKLPFVKFGKQTRVRKSDLLKLVKAEDAGESEET